MCVPLDQNFNTFDLIQSFVLIYSSIKIQYCCLAAYIYISAPVAIEYLLIYSVLYWNIHSLWVSSDKGLGLPASKFCNDDVTLVIN